MKQIEWNVIIKVKLKQIKIHETLINFCENSGKWGEEEADGASVCMVLRLLRHLCLIGMIKLYNFEEESWIN